MSGLVGRNDGQQRVLAWCISSVQHKLSTWVAGCGQQPDRGLLHLGLRSGGQGGDGGHDDVEEVFTLVLDQEGKLEMMVMMMLKESFTLLLDQEGKAELSCEDAEGRTYNRTEWAAEFLFSQLQVALLLIILLLSEHQDPLFQSPADDRVQLLWLDQSKEGTQVPSGPDYCHHDGRQVKINL